MLHLCVNRLGPSQNCAQFLEHLDPRLFRDLAFQLLRQFQVVKKENTVEGICDNYEPY